MIKDFVNRKTGLSTDSQPSPTALAGVFYIETDTGAIYLSNGIITTQVQGPYNSESPRNKTLNAEFNNINTATQIEDFPFNQGRVIKGGMIPAGTIDSSFYGNLVGISTFNPLRITSSNDGILSEFNSSTFKDKMGFSSQVPIATVDGYSIKGEFKTTAPKMMVGFSTSPSFDPNYVLSNTDSGIAIGFTKEQSNYTVYNNDANGLVAVITSFPILKDSNLHTFEIDMSIGSCICKVDGYSIVTVNRIPSTSDQLYLLSYGIN